MQQVPRHTYYKIITFYVYMRKFISICRVLKVAAYVYHALESAKRSEDAQCVGLVKLLVILA